MKDLIRKILKETEEFDWAKEILNKPISSGAELLYLELKKFLEPKKAKNGSNYRVDVDRDKKFPEQDIYHVRDNTGTYESWFARSFNIKSLKSELERIMNQTRSENVQKEYENLLKDLEPFFKKTMLREVEEFDWAKEIIDRDIILKIENLRIGDIVIPTCAIQEEFIVVHAGFKPEDIFSEKKHFEALLKRNTTKNTGGIYLSTENEFGRNCQFKLIDRPSLNEDKEEEFDWINDIKQFTPAEEFLFDLMSSLTIVESKKWENYMLYKDENGRILMADDINTGTKNPSLYVDYDRIWVKLRGYGLKTEEIKALCVRMLEATHKRKVLTAKTYKFTHNN